MITEQTPSTEKGSFNIQSIISIVQSHQLKTQKLKTLIAINKATQHFNHTSSRAAFKEDPQSWFIYKPQQQQFRYLHQHTCTHNATGYYCHTFSLEWGFLSKVCGLHCLVL